MPSKVISFVFKVDSITSYVGVPVRRHFANELDYAGDLVSIKRLPGESNADFKNRIYDVSVHPGGPTETRIINGISRDLGFLRKPAMTIDITRDVDDDPVANAPRVIFYANRVVLYNDWRPDGTETIDREIRFYQPEDEGFYLEDLVSLIDASPYFSATIDPDVRPNLHSMLLIREDSINVIFGDYIDTATKIELAGDLIVEDSVSFEFEDSSLEEEVSSEPGDPGEYRINYTTGTIELYREPTTQNSVTYYHNVFPLEIDYTPIQIFSLNDDDFVDELFIKETVQSGEEIRTLPNAEGSEIYHTLFKETNNLWGK